MRVVLQQVCMRDYRSRMLSRLFELHGGDLEIVTGNEMLDGTRGDPVELHGRVTYVRNRFPAGRRLIWQSGVLRPLVRAEVAVINLNPRIVQSWVALLGRRLLGRPSVLWGHAFPRRGRDAATDRLRGLMRRLAEVVVVFTEAEAAALRERLPGVQVVAAPNALYEDAEIAPAVAARPPRDLIYVGRLVSAKKPALLLEAFSRALDELPADTELLIVGDGPLRAELEAHAAASPARGRVRFLGHISEVSRLRELYAGVLASVSPGYVGLSITQSLSFGVPMVVARGENHSPEIEAVIEGFNAVTFQADSAEDLARRLVEVVAAPEKWVERRGAIASDCARRYSADRQAERLTEAISGARRRAGANGPSPPATQGDAAATTPWTPGSRP